MTTVFTDDPALVAGCVDCLELAAEGLVQDNEHWANCLHCQQEISAQSGVEWRRTGASPDPGVEGVRVGAAGVSGSSVGPVCRCPVKIPAVTMSISKVIDPGSILACAGEPAIPLPNVSTAAVYPRVCGGTPSVGWWSHYEIISLMESFVCICSSCHCNSSVRILIFSNFFRIYE